jgi:hypothetical protein
MNPGLVKRLRELCAEHDKMEREILVLCRKFTDAELVELGMACDPTVDEAADALVGGMHSQACAIRALYAPLVEGVAYWGEVAARAVNANHALNAAHARLLADFRWLAAELRLTYFTTAEWREHIAPHLEP